MTPAYGAILRVLTGVLAASIAMVTSQDAVSLVPGQLEPWTALTGHTPFRCLFADVGTAVLLIHTVEALHRAVDACVLVVTKKETVFAATFITAHGVDTSVLAPAIVELAFIHIKTVMSIMCQIESIITSAAVIAWYIVALMHTATIVLQVTFISVFALFSISFKAWLTRALVRALSSLTNSINVTAITSLCTWICSILRTSCALATI